MKSVFVYGTLKRQGSNHRFLAGQQFISETQTTGGYTLHSLGDYPGMVRSGNADAFVTGEIWRVDETCLAQLDALEGVDEGLYVRENIQLAPPFHTEPVETYRYLRSVEGRRMIGSTWGVTQNRDLKE